jgi:hypothetical protein
MSGIKSAADGHLDEKLFGQTHSQKGGSHDGKSGNKRVHKIVTTGHPDELKEFHGGEMGKGTSR